MPRTPMGAGRTRVTGVRFPERTAEEFQAVCTARQEQVNTTLVRLMENHIDANRHLLDPKGQAQKAALRALAAEYGMTVAQLRELLDAHRPDPGTP